jgi:rare lipoprotein A
MARRPASFPWASLALLLSLVAGCSATLPEGAYRVNGRTYVPLIRAEGYRETGVASWYGDEFHGRRTSSGETYDKNASTVAHRTLPLGTIVRIRNLENDRTATARVNDRGPFEKDRLIDCSQGVAKELGLMGPGTARVSVEAIGQVPGVAVQLSWQVGSFAQPQNAEEFARGLRADFPQVRSERVDVDGESRFRVFVGSYRSRDQAEGDLGKLRKRRLSPLLVSCE